MNNLFVCLFILLISCTFLDTKNTYDDSNSNKSPIITMDSASYVKKILFTNIHNKADSIKAMQLLSEVMGKKFVDVDLDKKKNLEVALYCEDKPISFFFFFKDSRLFVSLYNGKKELTILINSIVVSSIARNPTKEEISFCFGQEEQEDDGTYFDCDFSGSMSQSNEKLMVWSTPINEFVMSNFIDEKHLSICKIRKIGCK